MIDIVLVAFETEISYLEIQAKSIDLYIDQSIVNSIIVIVNDHPLDINPQWWGQHSSKVTIIHRNDLTNVEWPAHPLHGWHNQQLCKLLACSQATATWSLILDAKTWFIQPLCLENFFDESGRVNHIPNNINECFRITHDLVGEYFNINLNNSIIGPAGVPFIMNNPVVRDMISHIGLGSTDRFVTWFLEHHLEHKRITEFILYSGYVLYKFGSYDILYHPVDHLPKSINISDWEYDQFDRLMDFIEEHQQDILTVALHRKSYPKLSESQKNRWLTFANSKKLITHVENTKTRLNTVLT